MYFNGGIHKTLRVVVLVKTLLVFLPAERSARARVCVCV